MGLEDAVDDLVGGGVALGGRRGGEVRAREECLAALAGCGHRVEDGRRRVLDEGGRGGGGGHGVVVRERGEREEADHLGGVRRGLIDAVPGQRGHGAHALPGGLPGGAVLVAGDDVRVGLRRGDNVGADIADP